MIFDIDKELLKALLVMADVIEARDPYTGGHVWRVSQLSKLLALEYGMNDDDAIRVSLGGYLHDIGKVGIPDTVLGKQGKLTNEEFEIIKTHPSIGANLVREHPLGLLVMDVVQHHHERLDGRGYPDGLGGSDISIPARLVSIADAFDALTSSRPYRQGMTIDEAIRILKSESGAHYDSEIVGHLISLKETFRLAHIVGHSEEGIPLLDCSACGSVLTITRYARDGDIAFCRVCTAKNVLHLEGDVFHTQFTGEAGTAQDVQPNANMDVINDILEQVPGELEVGSVSMEVE
jgi:putative nucleotidyltransferase with HDIG domain